MFIPSFNLSPMKNRLISKLHITLLLVLSVLIAVEVNAQSGAIDATFNQFDEGIISGPNNIVWTSAVQTDGKMLIGGDFTSVSGVSCGHIARLNQDGTLDNTFISGTGFDYPVLGITIQPDGKILVQGDFYTYNGASANQLIRLNTDGSQDNTFSVNVLSNTIKAVALQPDGRIVIGGSFSEVNGNIAYSVARVNTDGSYDPSFTLNIGATWNTIHSMAAQPDGKILIGGLLNGTGNVIMRLNLDGTQDLSFALGGSNGSYDRFRVILPQTDGSVFVGGYFSTYNSINHRGVVHLLSNGTIDPGFTIGYSSGEYRDVYDMIVLPNGKIIAVGGRSVNNNSAGNCLTQLNADGSIDAGFTSLALGSNTADSGNLSNIYTVSERIDGTFLMGGSFGTYTNSARNLLAVLNTDGTLVESFNAQKSANASVDVVTTQTDGKVLIGGQFTSYDGFLSHHIARLNIDGSIDQTFNSGFIITGIVNAITLQPDGKIVVVYNPLAWDSNSTGKIVRLNTDGSIDATFNTTINSTVDCILLLPDGKIMISGNYISSCNMTPVNKLFRLNSDGTLDLSFNPGSGPSDYVKGMLLQADGKLILHGNFLNYNNTYCHFAARINPDGSLDETFNLGSGVNNSINTIAQQIDGRLIVSGFFNSYNGIQNPGIIRIFPDGTLDPTFSATNVNSNLGVHQLTIGSDGSVFFITYFDPFNLLTNVGTINRLKPNGSYDPSFIQGNTSDFTMKTFALQSDGKILIGGFFQQYNNEGRNCLVRIENYPIEPEITAFTVPSIVDSCTGSVYFSVTGIPDFTFDIGGGNTVTSSGYAVFDSLCPGIYTVEVTDGNGDLMNATFIVPSDSSHILIDPFINNPPLVDSITTLVENCDIDYTSIDTAYFDSYTFIGTDTVVVNWAIVDMNGTTVIPTTFVLSIDGNYYFQLQFYCPEKAVGEYFVITQGVVYQNGQLSTTVGLTESEEVSVLLYPNPTNNDVTILFSEPSIRLTLTDASGKVITTRKLVSGEKVSLTDLHSGVYFFTIVSDGRTIVKRIVKN